MTCQWKMITNAARRKQRFCISSLQCADKWETVFDENIWGCSISAFEHEIKSFGAGGDVLGGGRGGGVQKDSVWRLSMH